jgi:hypothetical protein
MVRWLVLAPATVALIVAVAGCGSGGVDGTGVASPSSPSVPVSTAPSTKASTSREGRPFAADYQIRLDPDRTLRIQLEGAFTASEDKSDADAGMTEILVQTKGQAKVTNVSDGRNTDDFDHGFELFLPVATCPNWSKNAQGNVGKYCTYDLFNVDAPSLDAGESGTIKIDKTENVDQVPVADAARVLSAIMGPEGVLVSADRVFLNQQLEKLNPTCKVAGGDALWVTYYSESDSVNACSTEPGAK